MPARQNPLEARLAAAARAGSHEAYATLVERYRRPLFRFLRMRTANAEDAEELLQDSLLRGWTQLQRFDHTRSFSAWLYTIAARLAVSRGRQRSLPLATERELAEIADGANPASTAEQHEARRNLWDLAASVLSETQRCALWLAYAEDRSAREIGSILGREEGAVRVMLCRARRRLAAHLDNNQHEDSDERSIRTGCVGF